MKKLLFCFLLIPLSLVHAQYSFRSAGSNSGAIVGTNDPAGFADINYDLSSSKLGFAYRQIRQQKIKGPVNRFPDFVGHSVYVGVGISSGKSTVVKNNIWQGNIEAAYDLSYTWDKTSLMDSIPKLRQTTLFGRLSGAVGTQNLAIPIASSSKDSLSLISQTFTVPRIAFGLNIRREFKDLPRVLFTGAVSVSYYFLPRSTGRLKEYTFQQVGTLYNGGKTVQLSDSKSYYLGNSEYEGVLNPRLDLVASIFLGKKTVPQPNKCL